MSPPTVATIILNWNRADLTIECAESVLLAYEQAGEDRVTGVVVIVDNGSEVEDAARIENWRRAKPDHRVELVRNRANLGFAAGMNAGLGSEYARDAAFFWLLNNDTVVAPDALLRLVEFSAEYPRVAIVGSTVLDQSGSIVQSAGGFRYYPWLGYSRPVGGGLPSFKLESRALPLPDYVDGAVLWLRGEFLRRIGGLPIDNFLYFEELYLNLLLQPGEKIGWCRQAVVRHRGGASVMPEGGGVRATYYAALSAYRYTARVHPICLPTVILSRLVGISVRALRLRQPMLPVAVLQALWAFVSGRPKTGPETGSSRL